MKTAVGFKIFRINVVANVDVVLIIINLKHKYHTIFTSTIKLGIYSDKNTRILVQIRKK